MLISIAALIRLGGVARLLLMLAADLILGFPDLPLGFVQGLLDQPQHELPLGEFVSGAVGLPLQVGFDALEKGLVDLEGHGPGVVVWHSLVSPVLFQFEVFEQQICDVLAGGLTCLLSGCGDFLVQVEVDQSAEVLCLCHGVRSFR